MSFTAEVKDELSHVEPTCPQCDRAELSALVRIQGTLSITGGEGRAHLDVATETASVARTLIRLIHGVYGLATELTVRRSVLHKTHNYLITVPSQQGLALALEDMGLLGESGFEQGIKPDLVERGCCAGAYLRGAFLSGGYISDPRGDFHFELTSSTRELADGFVALMAANGIKSRAIRRHSSYLVYIKSVDEIVAFLAFVGAHQSALSMENARVIKSVRNDTNRRVNAEIANQVKASEAAMGQIARIERLVEEQGADALPPSLREVAELRVANPHLSIKELGELADPPLSKSAVYHRLRRIDAMLGE